jgi:glycerol-3-phosphate acyltransferase PlsX
MGGDHGPSVTLPACRAFLDKHPQATWCSSARPRRWRRPRLAALHPRHGHRGGGDGRPGRGGAAPQARFVDARGHRAAEGRRWPAQAAADACVSAGNTGALMAIWRATVLKTLEGIDRPAIAAVLPNRSGGFTTVLDLGANVDCTPEHLLQFAVMGSAWWPPWTARKSPASACSTSAKRPSRAARPSSAPANCCARRRRGQINFHGNVEGNDIFKGTTDIVVCDGFVGNVMLKTSEGLASMLSDFIRQEFTRNPLTKLAALVACRCSSASSARGPAPLQRRGAAGPARAGLQEPRFGRRLRLRAGPGRAYDAARNRLLDRVHDRIPRIGLQAAQPRSPHEPPHDEPPPPALFPHRRHRQLPAAAPRDQCRGTVGQLAARGVETSDEWIVERTGIRARHFADDGVNASDLALVAARHALEAAGARRRDRPDHRRHLDAGHGVPVDGCILQHKLGIAGCPAFDVQAVCSGFVYALTVADAMIRAGTARARWSSAPRSSRASSTSTTAPPACCSATAPAPWCWKPAPARHPGHRPACRRPPCRHPVRAGHVSGGQVLGDPLLKMDGQAVFKLAVGVLDRPRAPCWPRPAAPGSRHRLADPAPGQHPHHAGHGEAS